MHKAVNLLLSGLDSAAIRNELHDYLGNRKGDGSMCERGVSSRTQVVNILMNVWVSPDEKLVGYRDSSLELLQAQPSLGLFGHWGMISAAYPFWFEVARQTGRLLSLQNQVAQSQIIGRLKEQYGDRQTVARYARYTLRSFFAWGVLIDSRMKGCYEKRPPLVVPEIQSAVLLIESVLHATSSGKGALGFMMNSPALFPFELPSMSGEFVSAHNPRIDVVRYGLDEQVLELK